jgi:hypothetical protein
MPDQTRQTISATESPALFNVSPYVTRWMLWQRFARGLELDSAPDARMTWGKKLQPLIIAQAAEDLKLHVVPNADDTYHRRGPLGCTRDATIICPDRGPGALETKCVFDYRTWMADWGGGASVPKHNEIQLQQQMLVGDETDGIGSDSYGWGVIAVWVAGDVHYFERRPIEKLWRELANEAERFFLEVRGRQEPDPFGAPIELPWLTELFPVVVGKEIDCSDDAALTEAAIQYRGAKEQESAGARTAESLRAKLLAVARDAETVLLADGWRARIRPHGKGKRIVVSEPVTAGDLLMAG